MTAAVVTGVCGAPMNAVMLPLLLALLAAGDAAREPSFLDVLQAGVISCKLAVEVRNGVPQMLWD